MPIRKANAVWEGNLKEGKGSMKLGSGAFEGAFSFGTRFGEEKGTNPEELVGAAHAGCFSMAFSNILDGEGFTPTKVETSADVLFEKTDAGFRITKITLNTKCVVPGIEKAKFLELADKAKVGCPISNALKAVDIELVADLV